MMLGDKVGVAIIFQGVCTPFDHNPVKMLCQYVRSLAPPPAGGTLGDRLACLCLDTILSTCIFGFVVYFDSSSMHTSKHLSNPKLSH